MKKSIAILLIICAVLLSTFGAVVSGVVGGVAVLDADNYLIYRALTKSYSNDENFIQRCGGYVIKAFSRETSYFVSVSRQFPTNSRDDSCTYQIFSAEPLELKVGDNIGFTCSRELAYDGQRYPIVELRRYNPTIGQDEVLLEFEEGKANLLKWVEDEFSPKLFKWCI